jgi:hypothetical protein
MSKRRTTKKAVPAATVPAVVPTAVPTAVPAATAQDIRNAIEGALEDALGDVTVTVEETAVEETAGDTAVEAADTADTTADTADPEIIDVAKVVAKRTKKAPAAKKVKPTTGGRVGRPRKNNSVVPIIVQGVVAEPINDGDLIEMVYCKPLLFQKIIGLLKGYKVSEVDLQFDREGMTIDTRVDTTKIIIKIAGAGMNVYYCKAPMRVWIKCSDLEKAHSTLGQSHYKITWLIKENAPHIMYVVVKESEYESDDINEIEVYDKADVEADENYYNDADYPLKFHLSTSHLKKKIEDAHKISNTTALVIEKTGGEALELSYDTKNAQKNNRTVVYNNNSKIGLESTIQEDDVFRVSVSVANILPFVKAAIGSEIYISADQERKISFTTLADRGDHGWTASVKIYTSIVG